MINYIKQAFTLRRIRLLMVYALIFFGSGFIGNIWMTRDQVTGLSPPIDTVDLEGQDYKLKYDSPQFNKAGILSAHKSLLSNIKELNGNKPRLLYFFAEWCPICKLQHSVISAINEDFDVLGIAMQSGNSATVKKYVLNQNIDFKVINDESGEISRSFGVNGVPAAFVVDKKGSIKYSTRGYATEAGLRSRIWLAGKS